MKYFIFQNINANSYYNSNSTVNVVLNFFSCFLAEQAEHTNGCCSDQINLMRGPGEFSYQNIKTKQEKNVSEKTGLDYFYL